MRPDSQPLFFEGKMHQTAQEQPEQGACNKQAAHKAEKIKQDAVALADKIGEMTVEIATKAGEKGKIFGAITPLQISDKLKEKGFEIDRKRISIRGSIKNLGDYEAELDLHKEIKHPIKLSVVAE